MIYRVFNIDYDIEPEDLDLFEEDFEDEDEYNYACYDEIETIKAALPNELILEVEEEDLSDENIDEILCDMISDETGWLVYNYDYEKVEEVA